MVRIGGNQPEIVGHFRLVELIMVKHVSKVDIYIYIIIHIITTLTIDISTTINPIDQVFFGLSMLHGFHRLGTQAALTADSRSMYSWAAMYSEAVSGKHRSARDRGMSSSWISQIYKGLYPMIPKGLSSLMYVNVVKPVNSKHHSP